MADGNGSRVGIFSSLYLDTLVAEACTSLRRRQHRNIHKDYADPCQRFFNAVEPESYIRPHKHLVPAGAESLFAVRGRMALVVFDDSGEIAEKVIFSTGAHGVDACGVDVPNGCWHTVVALDPGSVLLEIKAGPFEPTQAKNFASWAPEEGTVAAREYAAALRRAIGA